MKASGSPRPTVVLVEPEIPPNTGNIARLCAALEIPLVLAGRLGFRLDDRSLRRAGLDYWDYVDVRLAPDVVGFFAAVGEDRLHLFSKRAEVIYTEVSYRPQDLLVFGSETRGLPQWLFSAYPHRFRRLPIHSPHVRSINLSSAVAAVVYEVVRQLGSGGWEAGKK